ncbi:D-alanine--D-alanine ligase family protein [Tunicatimonas pelagia]|uniref:D-alanine--D-alanine ligase family protein n=1 Tax=Tunicatimonas pelagia TaxID=931531 RepID=UPI002665C0F1|nr:hypothetical protein [Tunicatimonas pelagia]WKN41862.1 hypothetical protein P0M28_22745 [Tunicatimonas pelagia]
MTNDQQPHLIHFIGSPSSWYEFRLSLIYATQTIDFSAYREQCLLVFPDEQWLLLDKTHLKDFSKKALSESQLPKGYNYYSEEAALCKLPEGFTLISHVFCQKGMIGYRVVFEKMPSVQLVGSNAQVIQLTQSKLATKQVVAEAGLPVPDSIVLESEESLQASWAEIPQLGKQVIVKPDDTDNSVGLSLVQDSSDREALTEAWEKASQQSNKVLVEEYIAGREIRSCVVETNKGFIVPAMIEYQVSDQHPIRAEADKLSLDAKGMPLAQSSYKNIAAICPADLNEKLHEKLRSYSIQAHQVLGCRQFSIFDFRVSDYTQEAYLLEAGLYWSFSPQSMISKMLTATNMDFAELSRQVVNEAADND